MPIYIEFWVIDSETEYLVEKAYVLSRLRLWYSLDLPEEYDIKKYTHWVPPRVYADHFWFPISEYFESWDSEAIKAAKEWISGLFKSLGIGSRSWSKIKGDNGEIWGQENCKTMVDYFDTFSLWDDEDMKEIGDYYNTQIKPCIKDTWTIVS